MSTTKIVLPGLQLAASLFLLFGFAFTVSRVLLGYNVLNDWQFMFSSALVSLLPAILILIGIFMSKPFRGCHWKKKWPFVTLLVSCQIFLGSFMLVNSAGYFVNRLLPVAESYTAEALVIARMDDGYKQFAPGLLLFSNLELGEKNVSRETWQRIEEGEIVPVLFQRGYFGFTNILAIDP